MDKCAAALVDTFQLQANDTRFVEIESDPVARDIIESVREKKSAGALRSVASSAPDLRRLRSSKEGSPLSALPMPPPRGSAAPQNEATSNPDVGHLRANGLLAKLRWQVRAAILTTLLGPPTASLILLAVFYFEYWQASPFKLADFLAMFLLFAIPVGYVFGTVPALVAALLYCVLLTVKSSPLQRRWLTRACVAAACGGLASGVWFWLLRTPWGIYALVGALVMAASSLGTPQLAGLTEKGWWRQRPAPQSASSTRT